MAEPRLTPPVFSILAALIEDRTGLHYKLEDSDILAGKVGDRAAERGFDSFLDYYYYLRYDDPEGSEMNALVEALVVNETYLFRELAPLRAMVDDLIAPRVERGERPRIWCAACSTGEEPFSIAMLLAERGILDRVTILATDISSRVLSHARLGVYRGRALRVPTPESLTQYLEVSGTQARVAAVIRDSVEFQRVNLLDSGTIAALGRFHVIACRNVLIYFSDSVTRGIVGTLASALLPGGHLLVGAAESLLRLGTMLQCEERRGTFFYAKCAP